MARYRRFDTTRAGAGVTDTVPEVIEDGVSGYLVPPGDAVTLARRIADVLRDEGGRLQMGQRGRQRVENQFTFASQNGHYQRLFEQLVAKRTRLARRA